MDSATIRDVIVQVRWTSTEMRGRHLDVANDLREAGLFSLRSGQQQNRAQAKEQHQACTRQAAVENRFHGCFKSKRKRESATDISDMIEGRQFDKNSKNPALIERRYSRRAM